MENIKVIPYKELDFQNLKFSEQNREIILIANKSWGDSKTKKDIKREAFSVSTNNGMPILLFILGVLVIGIQTLFIFLLHFYAPISDKNMLWETVIFPFPFWQILDITFLVLSLYGGNWTSISFRIITSAYFFCSMCIHDFTGFGATVVLFGQGQMKISVQHLGWYLLDFATYSFYIMLAIIYNLAFQNTNASTSVRRQYQPVQTNIISKPHYVEIMPFVTK